MNTYKWDHQLIKKICKDPQAKRELGYLLDRIYHKPSGRFVSNAELFDEDFEVFDDYRFVFPIADKMSDDSNPPSYKHYEKDLDIDTIMNYFHTFIEFLDPDVREIVFKALAKSGQLQINKINPSHFYNGATYYSCTAQEHFTEVTDEKNLETLTILAHEFGHVYSFYQRKDMPVSKANHCLTEVEGKFWEFLMADFCMQISKLKGDAEKVFHNLDDEITNQANALFYKFLLCTTFKKEQANFAKDKNYRKFFRLFAYNYGFTKNDQQIVMNTPLENTSDYLLSYLTASSLYTIYKTDQQKAWYIFKKIAGMERKQPIDMVKDIHALGINFEQEIDSFSRKRKRN